MDAAHLGPLRRRQSLRLLVTFPIACAMALALFALMLAMVLPPKAKVPDDPLSVANFVRLDGRNESTTSRSRQQAPEPPQPQAPQTPQPPKAQPMQQAQMPKLDLPLPRIDSGIAVSSAPAPSLAGLSAAPSAPPSAPPSASSAAPGKAPGGPEQEVVPLNDIRPEYPQRALARRIEGHIKLAFTITPKGTVENVRVVEASPPNVFDREARRAAVRWRFAPRTENGLAVAREAVKTLHFRLE